MNETKKNNLTKAELQQTCADLESQVEQGLKQQQQLIKTKNELDDKLRRFELIQKYGREALGLTTMKEFGVLTLEYFIEIFNQARAAFIRVDEEAQSSITIATFGFPSSATEDHFKIESLNFDDLGYDCFLLSDSPKMTSVLKDVQFVDAYVCPIVTRKNKIAALVLLGQSESESQYFPAFDKADFGSLSTMCQFVGSLLQNLITQKALKYEIKERMATEGKLYESQKKLLKVKNELENKVVARTHELEVSNEKLKSEAIERGAIQLILEEQAEELKRSNDDLKQFASAVSHDLKSPLRNIATFSDLIKLRYHDLLDDAGKEYLNIMSAGVDNMVSIIDGLLHLANISKPNAKSEYLDINDLSTNIIKSINQLVVESEAQIRIEELPKLYANRFQIERLLQNLIENAIKFRGAQAPQINISAKKKKNMYVFAIEDNGIGIEPQYKDKIFGLFQRLHTDHTYKGTGIGLSICKKVVEKHKGDIWFESEPQKGTTFFFSLPG